jgi:hypothetical protein
MQYPIQPARSIRTTGPAFFLRDNGGHWIHAPNGSPLQFTTEAQAQAVADLVNAAHADGLAK